jgi:chemotaxis protein MotB
MRFRRRRRKRVEHSSHDRWLVSYADFITLLFAFFVVLYSSAQVDKRKAGQLAMAIQVAFQQMGIFDSSNSKPELAHTEPMPFADVQMIENVQRLQALGRLVNPPLGRLATDLDRPDLLDIQARLEAALAAPIRKRTVSVTPTKEGVVVSLREAGFFDSGSTTLESQALPTLSAIVKVIGPERMRIRIEGYTDNVPIHSQRFDSNWELSTARATEIIKLFITKYAIAPERLSASGYGEYYPAASNETAAGRAMNRRVDLVILNSNVESLAPPAPIVVSASHEPFVAPPPSLAPPPSVAPQASVVPQPSVSPQ